MSTSTTTTPSVSTLRSVMPQKVEPPNPGTQSEPRSLAGLVWEASTIVTSGERLLDQWVPGATAALSSSRMNNGYRQLGGIAGRACVRATIPRRNFRVERQGPWSSRAAPAFGQDPSVEPRSVAAVELPRYEPLRQLPLRAQCCTEATPYRRQDVHVGPFRRRPPERVRTHH